MDDHDARAMRDQHSLDEAKMRRLQQLAAGDAHSPVEPYPQHGAQPALCRPADAWVEDYERTLAQERDAWEAVKNTGVQSDFSATWQAWRSAVEKRDRATRMLINQSLSPG